MLAKGNAQKMHFDMPLMFFPPNKRARAKMRTDHQSTLDGSVERRDRN